MNTKTSPRPTPTGSVRVQVIRLVCLSCKVEPVMSFWDMDSSAMLKLKIKDTCNFDNIMLFKRRSSHNVTRSLVEPSGLAHIDGSVVLTSTCQDQVDHKALMDLIST